MSFRKRSPRLGQVLDGQLALQHLQLKVKAQHDVQVVGHLVGFGADEGALHLVDGPVEGVEGDAAQLLGKGSLEARIVEPPEGEAAAHEVLPQARRALVHPGRGAFRQEGALQGGIDALLVEGVASLVEGAEKGLSQVALPDPVGDAHVADGKGRGEGMVCLVLASAPEIVAHALQHLQIGRASCRERV